MRRILIALLALLALAALPAAPNPIPGPQPPTTAAATPALKQNQLPPAQAPLTGIFLPAPAKLTNDPCGDSVTAEIGAAPDAPAASSGNNNSYDEESGEYRYSQPPAPNPKATTMPVSKTCEGGSVKIAASVPQHFGYRIGMRIPVTFELTADSNVIFDFSSLQAGVLAFDGSDFEITDDPIAITTTTVGKKKVWQVTFYVQCWVPRYTLVLNANLRYALKISGDGHTPAWQVLTTPDLVITTTKTLDGGKTMQEGDVQLALPQKQKLAVPCMILGWLLFLFFPVRALTKRLYRLTVRLRKLTAEEVVWNTFDRLIQTGAESGFDQEACRQIAVTLRQYFKVESALRSEIERVLPASDTRITILQRVLSACEKTYAGNIALPPQQGIQLVADLQALVPRAWHDDQ